jgi:flavorubredoxin
VQDVKDLDLAQLAGYDAIFIGSPNHAGGATRNIGNLVNKLGSLGLQGKKIGVFEGCKDRLLNYILRKVYY